VTSRLSRSQSINQTFSFSNHRCPHPYNIDAYTKMIPLQANMLAPL
jgi:hypothetical protein